MTTLLHPVKYLLLLFFLFLVFIGNTQTVDSILARQEIDSLIGIIVDLENRQQFDAAYLAIEKTAEKCQAVYGEESPLYATLINELGIVRLNQGRYAEAEAPYLQCLSLREKVLGKDHPQYAVSLSNLGILYYKTQEFEKAEKYSVQAKEIRKRILGEDHPEYAASLVNLGLLYESMGNFTISEQHLLEAKTILGKPGRNTLAYYTSCIENLANLYKAMSRNEDAERVYLETIAMREKLVGKEHYTYASALFNLADLYMISGNFEESESLFLESKSIWEKAMKKEHPDYALLLNNLGSLYSKLNNFEEAERFFQEAISIRARVLGEVHPDYAASVHNLALLNENMGNYQKAESLYLKSKSILEKVYGQTHPFYGTSVNNLGLLYMKMEDFDQAEIYLLEAVKIREKIIGKDHDEYASSLNNLALFYYQIGNYTEAESLLKEAYAIWKKTLGPEHQETTLSLHNLASVYLDLGRYKEAEPLFLEAWQTVSEQLGTAHNYYAIMLNGLVDLYMAMDNLEKAEVHLTELYQNKKGQLDVAFGFLSELEKENFIRNQMEPMVRRIQSSAFRISTPSFQTLQYDIALLTKGVQLRTGRSTLEYILIENDSAATAVYQQLLDVRTDLHAQYQLPPPKRQRVDSLEMKQETLEKKLARLSKAFRQEEAAAGIGSTEVRASLKQGEAAVEFVHFEYATSNRTDSIIYAAVVLLPDSGKTFFIPLFEEKQLDSLLQTGDQNKASLPHQFYSSRGFNRKKVPLSKKLFRLIWEPIDSLLGETTTVYFSPSGLLNRLNIAALPVSKKEILDDRYQLYQLSSTREIALKDMELSAFKNRNALVYGGIQYQHDPLPKDLIAAKDLSKGGIDQNPRGAEKENLIRRSGWNYLPGTAKEAEEISELLNTAGYDYRVLTRDSATEEVIKAIGSQGDSPRVIHLATHGYFFPDLSDSITHVEQNDPIFKSSNNPMIRSGLILAGANHAWKGQSVEEGQEDGILTALEISHLVLPETELVVLSACETALGDIKGKEGVFGLQRAFKLAGAKYLVMSLWQVPDAQTRELMVSFYSKWLTQQMEIKEAFRSAQQELREKYRNPYFWAAFVLIE